jgi:hypothetical protein
MSVTSGRMSSVRGGGDAPSAAVLAFKRTGRL